MSETELASLASAAAPARSSTWSARGTVERMLERADVRIGGERPWDIRVHDSRFYRRILSESFYGAGESYQDGWWDCEALDELFYRILRAGLYSIRPSVPVIAAYASAKLLNLQSRLRAREVCERHYDLGNDLFEAMLDRRMTYTCAYWKDAATLEDAQLAKLELVCRKMGLRPGMRVLDIGCGFGSFMKHAAERYGVSCVGYSLSREQTRLGRELCAGLPVEFVFDDYRGIRGSFDRVVSIGMFEAVGHRNYRAFMEIVASSLALEGRALLHTMGGNFSVTHPEPWFHKNIFPNGLIPSLTQISRAAEGLLMVEDLHSFGPDYARTLLEWNRRFQAAWPRLAPRYGERFKRTWEFYLLSLAGGFRGRYHQLWQIALARPGASLGDYRVS